MKAQRIKLQWGTLAILAGLVGIFRGLLATDDCSTYHVERDGSADITISSAPGGSYGQSHSGCHSLGPITHGQMPTITSSCETLTGHAEGLAIGSWDCQHGVTSGIGTKPQFNNGGTGCKMIPNTYACGETDFTIVGAQRSGEATITISVTGKCINKHDDLDCTHWDLSTKTWSVKTPFKVRILPTAQACGNTCAAHAADPPHFGNAYVQIGSVDLSLVLGNSTPLDQSEFIWLYADEPSTDLAKPISLQEPIGRPAVETLRDNDGAIRQVRTAQGLVHVKTISAYEYHLECYFESDVDPAGHQSDGFYATNVNAQPFVIWAVKNPDGVGGYTNLWISEVRGGLTRDFKYTYTPLYKRWDLLEPDGQTLNSTWSVPDASDPNVTNYFRTVSCSGQLLKKTQQTYLWKSDSTGKVITQEIEGDGAVSQTTTYRYYSDIPANGLAAGEIQRIDYPDGKWVYYEYDAAGRISKEYSNYGNNAPPPVTRAPIPTADLCRVTEYAYSLIYDPGEPDDDGIADSGDCSGAQGYIPRRTIVKVPAGDGNALREVSRKYCHVIDAYTREVQECPEPGALWGAPGNLRTITAVNGDNKPTMECRPDGTVSLYSYDYNYSNVTITTGKPDNSDNPSYILEGTQTDNSYDEFGNILRSTTRAIQSSTVTDIVLSDEIYNYKDDSGNYLDPLRRDHEIVSLNGRTNQFRYSCCGLERTVDTDGVTTYYEYDPMLKTQLGTRKVVGVAGGTEQIIETTNRLDGLGRPLATYRVGTDGSVITTAQYQYDLLGRIIRETNALGGAIIYTSIVDSASQTVKTNIYPDGGVRVETHLPGGKLARVGGNAAYPLIYRYGAEQDGNAGPWREILLEVKVGNAGETNEWTKTYLDGTGRRYKIAYAPRPGVDVSGPPSSTQYYNSQGQLWKEVDPDGVATLYAYNDLGEREYTITAVSSSTRAIAYDDLRSGLAAGTFQAGTDRIKRTERSFVAAAGGKPDLTRTDTFVWDNGQTTGTRISRSEAAANGLDRWSTVYGDGSVVLVTHDQTSYGADGARTSITTMPDNSHTTNAYAYGRLVSSGRGDASGVPISRTDYGYDVHGRQSRVTDARNGTTTYTFNNADQVATLTTPVPGVGLALQTTSTFYDKMLRVSSVAQPDGSSTTNEYAATGLVTKIFGGRTYPVSYGFDSQGRMRTMITWTNFGSLSGAATTTWNYNPYRGWLDNKRYTDTTGPDYTYTAAGRLKTRTWARTGTGSSRILTTYTYGFNDGIANNEHGDLVGVTYANDPQSTAGLTQSYNRRGLLATVVRGGITTTLSYNSAGQLLGEGYSGGLLDGLSVTSIYDPLLRRTNVSALGPSSLSVASYGYDGASRLQAARNESGDSATYTYLANSPLIQQIAFKNAGTPRMTTTKQYDFLNRLTQISSTPSSGTPSSSAYDYNLANQRIRNVQADGSYWRYQYDALGQVTSGKKYWSDQNPVAGQQFGYGFDDIGNRRSFSAGGDSNGEHSRSGNYAVNALNQITSREVPAAFDVMGFALGNKSVSVNNYFGASRQGEYFRREIPVSNYLHPVWQAITVTSPGETSITGNVYVPKNPELFAYDADGNLTSDGRWTYVWDAENRLVQMLPTTVVTVPDSAKRKLDFVYDYEGRRIQKSVSTWNGTDWALIVSNRFLYDSWNMVAELNATNNAVICTYLWGLDVSGSLQGAGGVGGLLAVSDSSKGRHFVSYDGNGNVMQSVASADGNISAVYEYGPFGEVLRATGTMAKANPLRFSTKYQDEETDLLYYGYRYYNASTGRWLSRDPLLEILRLPASLKDNRQDLARKKPRPNRSGLASLRRRRLGADPGEAASSYAFAWNCPIGRVDVLGLDVYKVIVFGEGDECCGCANHRLIVGDNGDGGFYTIDVQNPSHKCRGPAKIVYDGSGAGSAADEVARLTRDRVTSSHPEGVPGGREDGHVKTSGDVDAILADRAAGENGKPWDYTFIFRDCGTFANEWLKDAQQIQDGWEGD